MLVLPVDAIALALPALWVPGHAKAFLFFSALSVVLITGGGRYRARLHLSVLDEFPWVLSRVLTAGAVVAAILAIRHQGIEASALLSHGLVVIGLLLVGRLLTTGLILVGRSRRIVAHRTVVLGGGVQAAELLHLLDRYPRYGLFPVGFVDDAGMGAADVVATRIGRVDDLDRVVAHFGCDVILVADGELSESVLADVVRRPACSAADLLILPRLHQFHAGVPDHIGSIPIMRIRTPQLRGPAWAVKRVTDVVVSVCALVVLTPLMLAIAAAVRLEGGPGVIFRQERVGRDGRVFCCLKFRSMRPVTPTEAATRWTIADDPRVGPVGRVLRRLSLDELPQLWNIVRGDMTLIGPRPERPHFVSKFAEECPRYEHRHRVRAGLTGLAQVSGLRGDVPIADRARFDNYYIENWSLWLDLKVLLRTFSEIFLARGR
jgi:exopolysaccharide biosynthesis polyprenyl glycosylphosphotransferase